MTDLFKQADQPHDKNTTQPRKRYKRQPRKNYFTPRKFRNREPVEQPDDPTIRHIRLTKGQVAVVDAFLYEWLSQYNWHANWAKTTNSYYAARPGFENGVKCRLSMHREILGLKIGDPRRGDHQNRNTLCNLGSNLRYANPEESSRNCGIRSDNKSGFRGVYWAKRSGRWVAEIQVSGKSSVVARCKIKEDAARAYDRAAIKYHGKFAVLNFPLSDYLNDVGLDSD